MNTGNASGRGLGGVRGGVGGWDSVKVGVDCGAG